MRKPPPSYTKSTTLRQIASDAFRDATITKNSDNGFTVTLRSGETYRGKNSSWRTAHESGVREAAAIRQLRRLQKSLASSLEHG